MEEKTYTISTITRGMCIEQTSSKLVTSKYDADAKEQQWAVEKGEDDKTIALRNVSSKQYLRSLGRGDGAKVGTGDKMWWLLEVGDSPGTRWIKSSEHDNYLCNYYGHQTPNNKVWMWSSGLSGWDYTMMWYILDSDASVSFDAARDNEASMYHKQLEELQAREELLRLTQKEVAEQTAEANKRSNDFEQSVTRHIEQLKVREKNLKEAEARAKKRIQHIEAAESAVAEREDNIEARETKVSDKESEAQRDKAVSKPAGQFTELQNRLNHTQEELEVLKAAKQALEAREADVHRREQDVTYREEAFQRSENDLPKAKLPGSSTDASGGTESIEDNAHLRQRIQELEAQLLTRPQRLATPPNFFSGPKGRPPLDPSVIHQKFSLLPRFSNERGPLRGVPPLSPRR